MSSSPSTETKISSGEPLDAENVNTSPSTSSAKTVMVKISSSGVIWSSISVRTGASFTPVTIISISSDATALFCKSSTVKVRVSTPFQSDKELKVTSKFVISTIIFVLPDTVSVKSSPSISSI